MMRTDRHGIGRWTPSLRFGVTTRPTASPLAAVEQIVCRRYACGEIDAVEYRMMMAALRRT